MFVSTGASIVLRPSRQWPGKKRGVVLFDRALAQQGMKAPKRRASARDQEAPARVAVEPVREFEGLLGPQGAQDLDYPERKAGSTMNGKAGGLVEDEDARILVDD